MSYSKEEIEEFRKKDKRISISGIVQALIEAGADMTKVEENCNLAKAYSDKIWELAENNVPQKEEVLPAPTLQQQEVLEYIAEALKTKVDDKLKREILDFIEKEFNQRTYPTKKSSVNKFIEEKKK